MNPQEAKNKAALLLGGLVLYGGNPAPIEIPGGCIAVPAALIAIGLIYYFKFRRSPEGKKVLKQQRLWDNRHRKIELEFKNRDQLIKAINQNNNDILNLALNRNDITDIPNESTLDRRARLIRHQNQIDLEITRLEKLSEQYEEDARLFQNAVEEKTFEEGGGVLKGKNLRRVEKGRSRLR